MNICLCFDGHPSHLTPHHLLHRTFLISLDPSFLITYLPWPPQNPMSKLPPMQLSRQRHPTAIRLWITQSHDTTVEVSPPSWPPYNRLVNDCLLFTYTPQDLPRLFAPSPPSTHHFLSMDLFNSLHTFTTATVRPLFTRSQVVPPPPPSPKVARRSKTITHSLVPRRGQCTHITMNRLHGDNTCQMCGRIPNIGWLYACRQDWLLERQKDLATTPAESAMVPDKSNYFEMMAHLAQSLRMSPSVIKQIRDGLYTFDEVEKLVAQKDKLIGTVKRMESIAAESMPASQHSNVFQNCSSIIASLGATAASEKQQTSPTPTQQTSTRKDSPASTAAKQLQMKVDRCNYMVCHACRPFLTERIHVNIGSVVHGAQPPITEHEAETLRVLDHEIVRGFGTRQAPSGATYSPRRFERSESLDITTMHAGDGLYEDETPLEWTTSSNSSSMYDYDPEEKCRSLDPHPCPGPGVCPVYSRNSGCAYDSQDFDDGQRAHAHGLSMQHSGRSAGNNSHMTPDRSRGRLRRVESSASGTPGGTSSSASSISLPTPTTFPLTPDTPATHHFEDIMIGKPGKAATVCGVLRPGMNFSHARLSVASNMSVGESHESFGSEVEVDGGVALTEEAVETGLPDILTSAA